MVPTPAKFMVSACRACSMSLAAGSSISSRYRRGIGCKMSLTAIVASAALPSCIFGKFTTKCRLVARPFATQHERCHWGCNLLTAESFLKRLSDCTWAPHPRATQLTRSLFLTSFARRSDGSDGASECLAMSQAIQLLMCLRHSLKRGRNAAACDLLSLLISHVHRADQFRTFLKRLLSKICKSQVDIILPHIIICLPILKYCNSGSRTYCPSYILANYSQQDGDLLSWAVNLEKTSVLVRTTSSRNQSKSSQTSNQKNRPCLMTTSIWAFVLVNNLNESY